MIELPLKYTERMKKLLGNEFDAYLKELEKPAVRGFRVNTDKLSVADFEKFSSISCRKIDYVPTGFYLDYDKIGSHPYHHAGMIYVQEPGAMAPCECIDIGEDWRVLDMCASPGGKSTQLKNKLGSRGLLVSNEIIPSRCRILTGNIERLGLENTVTLCYDTDVLADRLPDYFDLVTVDAPCSGEGMFRKEPMAVSEWSEENVLMCAQRQSKILENAAVCVRNGGYIIYATCTFSVEENEMVIDRFLEKHPDFELVEVRQEVKNATCEGICFDGCKSDALSLTRRFYPHKSQGEGQFMAVLRNTCSGSNAKPEGYTKTKTADKKAAELICSFLDDTLEQYDKNAVKFNKATPVYLPSDFPIDTIGCFSCGVTIGEIKKGYVLPHHQFFMAMGKYFKRKIELTENSTELKSFLHGEEFYTDSENGWAVVTLHGCSVGGVKVVNSRAKNHYPKGLRTK